MKQTAWLCALIFTLFAQPGLAADETPVSEGFRADIEHLLDMTGAMEVGRQIGVAVATQVTAQLKQQHPELPVEALNAIPAAVDEVIEQNSGSLQMMLVALYAKHFTQVEIRQMIQFYETDLGRKLIRVMPQLASDSMALGMQWGRTVAPQLGPRVAEKLRAKGFDI